MNRYLKIVCSHTLQGVNWQNTKLINSNAVKEIAQLKQQPGKDIVIFGSANLITSLMDLIDEHRVMIAPLILRRGTPLFTHGGDMLKMRLADSRSFQSGNVLLTYVPDQDEQDAPINL